MQCHNQITCGGILSATRSVRPEESSVRRMFCPGTFGPWGIGAHKFGLIGNQGLVYVTGKYFHSFFLLTDLQLRTIIANFRIITTLLFKKTRHEKQWLKMERRYLLKAYFKKQRIICINYSIRSFSVKNAKIRININININNLSVSRSVYCLRRVDQFVTQACTRTCAYLSNKFHDTVNK